MTRTKPGKMITKNIDDMTIVKYMEYEAEMRRDPWKYTWNSVGPKNLENTHQPDKLEMNDYFPSIPTSFDPTQPRADDIYEPLGNDYHLFTPEPHYETEEVSSDEDVDEWLNDELRVSFVAEEEDGDSSKTLPYQQLSNVINPESFTLPCTIGNLKIDDTADVEAGINMMPKSLFKHLELANLKKTSMIVEMGDMTKRSPLGIVENIMVNIDKFVFHSDFVVIDTPEGPHETILLGRPFLATTHAQINVFLGEMSLGIGNERVKFDMNREICHSEVPFEKIYMASSILKNKHPKTHGIEKDDSPALEQGIFHYKEESIDTVDSNSDSQENEVGSHISENISRWHVCKPVHITFRVCEEDCRIWPTCKPDLSFCSRYDAIYGKEKNRMLKQWICFRDHERQNVRGNEIRFDHFLKIRYGNKNIDNVNEGFEVNVGWNKDDPYSRNFDVYKDEFNKEIEQCMKEGFEDEEIQQNGIEEMDYTPPLAKNETFKVHRYTFKNGKNFISITKRMDDILPLGRVNRAKFIEKTRIEMEEEGGTSWKT
ncbi:phospholipase-like protein [Tanacetum coccineum]